MEPIAEITEVEEDKVFDDKVKCVRDVRERDLTIKESALKAARLAKNGMSDFKYTKTQKVKSQTHIRRRSYV